ncbi:hypothetical protein AAG906_009155 [Vitis piasezkii]
MNGSSPNLNSAAPLLGNLDLWFLKYLSWQKPKGLNLSNRRRRLHPEMASFSFALQVNGLFHNHSISHSFDHLKTLLSSTVKVRISLENSWEFLGLLGNYFNHNYDIYKNQRTFTKLKHSLTLSSFIGFDKYLKIIIKNKENYLK